MNESTQAIGYLAALTETERTNHSKEDKYTVDNLSDLFSKQIIATVKESVKDLMEGKTLKITKVYLGNQLAQFLNNEQLGITGEENTEGAQIHYLTELDGYKIESDREEKIKKMIESVRSKVFEALKNENLSQYLSDDAQFSYTRVKSNIQPLMQYATKQLKNGESAIVVGAERMDGLANPGNELAKQNIPEEFLQDRKTDSMGKTIEGIVIRLMDKLGIERGIYEKFMKNAAAYSRLMSLKNMPSTANPQASIKAFNKDQSDLSNFSTILKEVEKDEPMTKYLYEFFKMSYCCINANGAAAGLLSKEQILNPSLAILAQHTEKNKNTSKDRYFGNYCEDRTINDAFDELFKQFNPSEDEKETMLACIHNAFSILIILFLTNLNKLEGVTMKEQMENFNQMTESEEGLEELQRLGIIPFGELFGGHPSGATALHIAKNVMDYFKNTPKEKRETDLALITSVWGPLDAVTLLMLKYVGFVISKY